MDNVIKVSGGVTGDYLKDEIKSLKYADVALCCAGGQRFLAHRLILSAASPYLHEVLQAHGTIAGQCEVITMILADVEGDDLTAILSFIYTGSAEVPKAKLKAFSSAADALRIKIPPLPYALTLPDGLADYSNHHTDIEYETNIDGSNNHNHLKDDKININFPKHIILNVNAMPTGCLGQLMTPQDYHGDIDDYCINLKLPETSTRETVRFKSHVANHVIASPWCQLATPHHSPKVRPIIRETYNLLSTDISCKNIPSAVAFSSAAPYYYSSLIHEHSTGSASEVTVGIEQICNTNRYDLSGEILFDCAEDMLQNVKTTSISNKSVQAAMIAEKIKINNSSSVREITHSPKICMSSRNQCQVTQHHDQSSEIIHTNLNEGTVGSFSEDDVTKMSLTTKSSIRWNDGNNNDNNESLVDVKNGENTFIKNQQYKCHICKRTFSNRISLKIHNRCHSGEKPFQCLDCGKEFSQLRNYKYHRSVHEGTGEFAGTCPECGKCFNDRGYLGSHMKIHRNRKEYICQECGKSFNQRVAYNMHVRIHTGVKPHHCEQCGKSFSRKMLLKQHLRTHSGERPYQCHICHKAFADRSNMTLHTKLHSGLKPYQCDICSKAFTKKHHLKTHLNYHTGTKPYSCPNCSIAFSQSSNMRTHYKKCILNKPDGNVSNKIES